MYAEDENRFVRLGVLCRCPAIAESLITPYGRLDLGLAVDLGHGGAIKLWFFHPVKVHVSVVVEGLQTFATCQAV